MKYIQSALLASVLVLSACSSTAPEVNNVTAEERALQHNVEQYPKDTEALQQLVAYQLAAFEAEPDLTLLSKLQTNLRKGLQLAPTDRFFAFQYYRLNLKKGFVDQYYDLDKWQAFYEQHPFLATIDVAPPVYVHFLISPPQSDSDIVRVLQQSLRDNPFFINAYVTLAYHYFDQGKLELASYVTATGLKWNSEAPELLSDWIHYRTNYLEAQQCKGDIGNAFSEVASEAGRLTKLVPDNQLYQAQLAEAFRFQGKTTLATFAASKAAKLDKTNNDFLLEMYLWDQKLNKILNDTTFDPGNTNVAILQTKIYANIAAGNWKQVTQLSNIYRENQESGFYGVVYGALSHTMLGDEAARQRLLATIDQEYKLSEWQVHMLDFAQGKITEAQLLDYSEDRCQQSEGLFIAALQQVGQRGPEAAADYWPRIKALNIAHYYEFAVAKYLMKYPLGQ